MTTPACETCDGARVVEVRARDGRGGELEMLEPCPDCGDHDAWAEHRERRARPRSRRLYAD